MEQEKLNDLLRGIHETTGSHVMLLMPDQEVITYPGTAAEFCQLLHDARNAKIESEVQTMDKSLQQKIIEYVFNHLSEDLSVQSLCRRFAVSKSELYRLLRRQAPDGIARYVRQLRFHRACELLRGTGKPLWQIAAEVGYENPDYFLRAFKKETGISAGKYRKAAEESE